MRLIGLTYKNDKIDDEETFRKLPSFLQEILKQANGLIAYKGGLHIRGCCIEPQWHSIREVWEGKFALWTHYPELLDIDIPFAQDCMGDQFLLQNEKVIKLFTETGEVEFPDLTLKEFFAEIEKDPFTFLGLQPLAQFDMEGGKLEAGQLLHSYPPFSANPGGEEITLKALDVSERLHFLFDLYKKMRRLKEGDGEGFSFVVG
jgi:hypothetical protein